MKKLMLILLLPVLMVGVLPAKSVSLDKSGCKIAKNGKSFPLAAKVKVVSSGGDIKVRVVNSFPDVKIRTVDRSPSCCEWRFVDSFPDFTIEYVKDFEDIKVEFVKSFPGF